MQCMKTGLRFNVSEFNYDTFHGDMFFNKTMNVCLIRGVASGTSDQTPDMILVTNGDAYAVQSMTGNLAVQLSKYYPDLDMTKINILISDSRFF